MKAIYLGVIYLFVLIILSTPVFSQLDSEKLEFTRVKTIEEGYTLYFNVDGITSESHAELILQELLNQEKIYDGRFFETRDKSFRIQLFVTDLSLSAEFVRSILIKHSADYDFTTVSVNGLVPNQSKGVHPSEINSTYRPVNAFGFPIRENTGNQKKDEDEYRKKKDEWIQQNPEEYEKLLKELE